MKLKLYLLRILVLLSVSACSRDAAPVPESNELPPTPYPDTPSPAQIQAPLVESPAIIDLDMFNELDGWAVTETEIVRTNDGGISWYNVSPPDMQETGYSVDTFFLDQNHAWVQKLESANFPNEGMLYATEDGGTTWNGFKVPFSRGDLNFVDAETGWMLADLGAGAGSNAVAVFHTTDGGSTWKQTYTNDPNDPQAGESLPLGGIKSGLVPLSATSAWVTGVIYAPGEVYLYRTEDGGRNWQPVTLPLPAGAQSFEIGIDDDQMRFVTPTDGYLALRMSGDSIQTAVYVSQDAGTTWSLTPAILNGAGASAFLTDQEAVLYNGEQFNVTRDGAQTWETVLPDISFGETFVNMEFVNTMSGWVITMDPSNHRSLYRTHDGGSTWLPVVP